MGVAYCVTQANTQLIWMKYLFLEGLNVVEVDVSVSQSVDKVSRLG